MQPLYFQYQVDCDRDDSSGDEQDVNTKISNTNKTSLANTPNRQHEINPNTPSIGPRLKRKGYKQNRNGGDLLLNGGQHHIGSPVPTLSDTGSQGASYKKSALRMVQKKRNGVMGKVTGLPAGKIAADYLKNKASKPSRNEIFFPSR